MYLYNPLAIKLSLVIASLAIAIFSARKSGQGKTQEAIYFILAAIFIQLLIK
jgi:hypothetical protein